MGASIWLLVFLPLAASNPSVGSTELAEAVDCWKQWRSHYENFRGRVKINHAFSHGAEFAVSAGMIRAIDDTRTLADAQQSSQGRTVAESTGQRAVCVNDRYGFLLTRESRGAPWVIVGREWSPAKELVASARGEWTQYVWAPYTVMEIPLCDFIARSQCRVKPMSVVSEDGRELRELRFSYTPSDDELSSQSLTAMLRGGMLTLDPAHKWGIVRSRLDIEQNGNPITATWAIEYSDDEGPLPRAAKVTVLSSASDLPAVGDIESLEFTPVPRSDFTLSAFGLPEPDESFVVASDSAKRRVFIYIGAALIVGTIALRAYKRFYVEKPRESN